MAEHAVVIAGGGPTGLMLAGELALAGLDVAIVERRYHELRYIHDVVGIARTCTTTRAFRNG
jgi:2-polyprenyl-6-methoxyphenol hydroxylase-like FAD-dependent oxidoreductase